HNYEPKYIALRNKGNIINELRKAAAGASEVYLATDPDREGEAIAWHLLAITDAYKKYKRVTFNEITEEAIKKAFAEPRKLDMKLINAQQARRILDRLVGYKLSPLLWRKVKRGLSAGRVQSVAVRIIVDREREIEAFIAQEYWNIDAILYTTDQKDNFAAAFYGLHTGDKLDICNSEEADIIQKELESALYSIKKIQNKETIKRAQPPFTTSTMQQEAARKLHFSAKQTMALAQQLYEGLTLGEEGEVGLITYMRTDSVKVSKVAITEARDLIAEKYGASYVPEKVQSYSTRSRGAQEAHEAIRPTKIKREPSDIKKFLKPDQFRLYKLIWERMVASQMASAVYDVTSLNIVATAKSKKKYLLKNQSSYLKFKGFLVLYTTEESEQQTDTFSSTLAEGHSLNLQKVTAEQNFTKPPSRYTEGTLIKTLESEGIGRPSTYAPIISTITEREYVVKDSSVFKPTELGTIVNDLLVANFPHVFDVAFTAQMEDFLDDIADGKQDWVTVINNFYPPFKEQLDKTSEDVDRVKLSEEQVEEKCPHCGQNLVIKSGRFGKFLACPDYPQCKFTKSFQISTGVSCPQCGQGEIVEKRSKKSKIFYGCSAYPSCNYALFNKPVATPCPKCNSVMTEFRKKVRCNSCGHTQKA
ncbi:MAG: type I DNA topoisomerase, partial [Chloroflexi bacterium]|nr:type I DNA topoisomerase [Chloroflexota bacterium]